MAEADVMRLWEHVTPAFKELHWLPIAARVQYKLCKYWCILPYYYYGIERTGLSISNVYNFKFKFYSPIFFLGRKFLNTTERGAVSLNG